MTLTDRTDVITEAVFDKLVVNKSALGLQDVWYGDQDRMPRTPACAVEPGPKARQHNGTPRRFLVEIDVYVMLYVEKIQDTQENEREMVRLAEETEEVLHSDARLGGLVVHSFVLTSEPGYVTRGGTLLRATRLTFRTTSQKQLPYS